MDSSTIKPLLAAALRHALTLMAGALVAHGLLNTSQANGAINILSGIVIAALGFGWSMAHAGKLGASAKTIADLTDRLWVSSPTALAPMPVTAATPWPTPPAADATPATLVTWPEPVVPAVPAALVIPVALPVEPTPTTSVAETIFRAMAPLPAVPPMVLELPVTPTPVEIAAAPGLAPWPGQIAPAPASTPLADITVGTPS